MSRYAVDLFAGCGGMARGLEWAGFECVAFNELDYHTAQSFQTNFSQSLPMDIDPRSGDRDGDIAVGFSARSIRERLVPHLESLEIDRLDLVTGGPPCQGYSGIGHRRTHHVEKQDIPTNYLYKDMARVIRAVRPRGFLFENVQGLISSKWTKDGEKGEIFRDVWGTFDSIRGYTCQATLLHGYGFGVPQNRPRVMIMGFRNEVLERCDVTPQEFDIDGTSATIRRHLRNNGGFFPQWDKKPNPPDIIDVIGDLDFEGWSIENQFHQKDATTAYQRLMRKKCRKRGGRQVVTEHEFSNHSSRIKQKFRHMIKHGGRVPPRFKTKKFSQKVLPERWEGALPNITVTSMPDDYVHYCRPRTLSVREWARLQSFPDHHVFCGKRTTGGPRRAGDPSKGDWDREVPKYTQVGNAVPPLMAKAIGVHCSNILE